MSSVTIIVVDAFTKGNVPFSGNPAAVVFLEFDNDISDCMKQKIANEINLPGTAFVSGGWEREQHMIGFNNGTATDLEIVPKISKTIRWFSPAKEILMCGHATVAAVKAIIEQLKDNNPFLDSTTKILMHFDSKYRGQLGAVYNFSNDEITLNFPCSPCAPLGAKQDEENWMKELSSAVTSNVLPHDCVKDIQYSPTTRNIVMALKDNFNDKDLRRLSPDFSKMLKIEQCKDLYGVIVTVHGKTGNWDLGQPHFYSRVFAPWYDVNEDPVCGSAHTVLAYYWAKEFSNEMVNNEIKLFARQDSPRGGDLRLTLLENGRVTLGAKAKLVIKGHIFVQPKGF